MNWDEPVGGIEIVLVFLIDDAKPLRGIIRERLDNAISLAFLERDFVAIVAYANGEVREFLVFLTPRAF